MLVRETLLNNKYDNTILKTYIKLNSYRVQA